MITNPAKFAEWFNTRVPGAYRKMTTQDIRDMTECGLIGRHRYFMLSDLQTVIGILQYEQLRQKRLEKLLDSKQPRLCKLCGQPLPVQPEAKKGRPRDYCTQCESSRVRQRSRKWRKKQTALSHALISNN